MNGASYMDRDVEATISADTLWLSGPRLIDGVRDDAVHGALRSSWTTGLQKVPSEGSFEHLRRLHQQRHGSGGIVSQRSPVASGTNATIFYLADYQSRRRLTQSDFEAQRIARHRTTAQFSIRSLWSDDAIQPIGYAFRLLVALVALVAACLLVSSGIA